MSENNIDWFYNEQVQVGTDYENEDEVKRYDEKMSKVRNIKEESENIIKQLNINEQHNVLEIGTGTGSFAIEVSKYCHSVYAVDTSNVMLSYAKKKAKQESRNNIEFINSGFLNYKHTGENIDRVISQLALHHLPDFWKLIALKNINSILSKKGKFYLKDIVYSFSIDKYDKTIDYQINNMKEVAGNDFAKDFTLHVKSEYSTYDWIMEEMLYRAGFEIQKADYVEGIFAEYICMKN